MDFPFRVTELEHAIIHLTPKPASPILLLGRSGTGKTTVCLYRLWDNHVRYWEKFGRYGPVMERRPAYVRRDSRQRQGKRDGAWSSLEEVFQPHPTS